MTQQPNQPDLNKVWAEYKELIEHDVLEDRREYMTDDWLASYPHFTPEEIEYLQSLVLTNFDPNCASLYRSQWDPKEALKVAECITESIHQDLEGWEPFEKAVITKYLWDLGVAVKAC